jgi:hypothetical protein
VKAARLLVVLASFIVLVACGERDQSKASAGPRADKPAWLSDVTRYDARGYRPVDKTAWNLQLRARAQWQNDYAPRN